MSKEPEANLIYWRLGVGQAAAALKNAEETGNKDGMGDCFTNIGNMYEYQSNYTLAFDYYLKALSIRKEINDILEQFHKLL